MSRRVVEMKNRKFGTLVVLRQAGRSSEGNVLWRCRCTCGREIVTRGSHLRSGNTKGCGSGYACDPGAAPPPRRRINARLITINGEERSLAEWSRMSGVSSAAISSRLAWGWGAYEAVWT